MTYLEIAKATLQAQTEPAEPIYRKAPLDQQCQRCRGLEARGVRVLLCSVCDLPQTATGPADGESAGKVK